MTDRYIMTAFGKDRPGIVADVTRLLFENGCNLEDTSMGLLADEFTLVLLFTCQGKEIEERLQRECRRLEYEGAISAFLRPLPKRQEGRGGDFVPCVLHVEGMDQAGIVFKVSQYLADQGINIFDLKSAVRSEPGSGSPFYVMDIHVQVPTALSLKEVEDGLSAVADDLNADISLVRKPAAE